MSSSPPSNDPSTTLTNAITSHNAPLTKVLLANNAFSSSPKYALTERQLQQALDTTFRELRQSFYVRKNLLREVNSNTWSKYALLLSGFGSKLVHDGNEGDNGIDYQCHRHHGLVGVFSVPAKTARELTAIFIDDVVQLERDIGMLRVQVEAKRVRENIMASQWKEAGAMLLLALWVGLVYLGMS